MSVVCKLEDLTCKELSELKTDDSEIIEEINRILGERVSKLVTKGVIPCN